MKLFKRDSSQKIKTNFNPREGRLTSPQGVCRSAPFHYVEATPAVNLSKYTSTQISMVKVPYDAATAALKAVGLFGVRFQVIVILDGSGSMNHLYSSGKVGEYLINILGFCLNIDSDGSIPVIPYGTKVGEPIDISIDNYQAVAANIRPQGGVTNMAEAYETALAIARAAEDPIPTMIINITDGNPYDGYSEENAKTLMTNGVIRSSGEPVFLKNISLVQVPYLDELDDQPSRYEVRKNPDKTVVYTSEGQVILDANPHGIRLIDNVDSQYINPTGSTVEQWAKVLSEEISDFLDASAQVGTITGVPNATRTIIA